MVFHTHKADMSARDRQQGRIEIRPLNLWPMWRATNRLGMRCRTPAGILWVDGVSLSARCGLLPVEKSSPQVAVDL